MDLNVGQENGELSGVRGQRSDHLLNKKVDAISDSKAGVKSVDGLSSTRKASRKAFGNVSNVWSRSSANAVSDGSLKHKSRLQTPVKEELKAKNSAEQVSHMSTNDNSVDPKFLDEIESMDMMSEQEMLDMSKPITADLFTIDERIILSQPFDDDMSHHLTAVKLSYADIDDIF